MRSLLLNQITLISLVAAALFNSCSPGKPHWEEMAAFKTSGQFIVIDSTLASLGWKNVLSDSSAWSSHKAVSSEKIGELNAAVVRLQFDYSEKADLLGGLIQAKYNLPFIAYLNGEHLVSRTNYDYPFALENSKPEKQSYSIYVYHRPINYTLSAAQVEPLLQEGSNSLVIYVPESPKAKTKYFNDFSFSLNLDNKKTIFTRNQPNIKPDGKLTTSELPILKVESRTPNIPDEPKVRGLLHIDYPEKSDHLDVMNLELAIEVRGTTSQAMSKKSFSINIGDHKDLETILGMPSAKKWVLYGPYMDRTLLRNAFMYSTSQKMGHYSTRFNFCELVINGAYQGIYMLCERIEFRKHRLTGNPIDRKDADSLATDGDFLLQIDRGTSNTWSSKTGQEFNGGQHEYEFSDPKADKLSDLQQDYVKAFLYEFETAIIGEAKNPDSKQYENYLNPSLFYDYIILNELSKNIDAYRLSTFLIKRGPTAGGKIEPGPVWDYNFSLGLPTLGEGYKTDGFIYNNTFDLTPYWWTVLMENNHFSSGLKKRYAELRQTVLHRDTLYREWQTLQEMVEPALDRNFTKWSAFGKADFWPNHNTAYNYQESCDYLNNWLTSRIAWLDEQWLNEAQ